MAIPKTIFQTFKTAQLPILTQWMIYRMKKRNPEYRYEFYDDERIDRFILEEFGSEVFDLYKRIRIGAAKADFFRYAILYKKGGVYLDIDSLMVKKLKDFITLKDSAIISLEDNQMFYVQWALVYEAGHPFLKKTIDQVLHNLRTNAFPNNVHQMTGPAAYSKAIKECLKEDPTIPHRQLGVDYDGYFKFHYRLSKLFLYGWSRKNHWKKQQQIQTVMKD